MSGPTPTPGHLGPEFLLWLWWTSEQRSGRFDLDGPVGRIDLWVDDRLAFRLPADTKVSAVLTGENPSHALEARAALAGGKVVEDLRIGFKRDDREFHATLRGASLDVAGLKLPQVMSETPDESIADRMFLYEEFALVVRGLFEAFAAVRTSAAWRSEVLPGLQQWLAAREG